MFESRAYTAVHAARLCDRVAEHGRASLARYGTACLSLQNSIIDVLRLEDEFEASLACEVTKRLSAMDAQLVKLVSEYHEAIMCERDAEVKHHELKADVFLQESRSERRLFLVKAMVALHRENNKQSDGTAIHHAARAVDGELSMSQRHMVNEINDRVFSQEEFDNTGAPSDATKTSSNALFVAAEETITKTNGDLERLFFSSIEEMNADRALELQAVQVELRDARELLRKEQRHTKIFTEQRDVLAAMRRCRIHNAVPLGIAPDERIDGVWR